MDIQTLCLGIVSRGETTGYEIHKLFEGPFRYVHEPSFGSIYPALTRLTQQGLVHCSVQPQEKRPDRKVYGITEAGRTHLRQALQKAIPGPDRIRSDFLATMLFQELLSAEFTADAIDARVRWFREILESLDCEPRDTGHAFLHGYGRAVCEAGISYLEQHRARLTGRAAAE